MAVGSVKLRFVNEAGERILGGVMEPCAPVVDGYFLWADLAYIGTTTDAIIGFEDENGAMMAFQFPGCAESGETCADDDRIVLLIPVVAAGVVAFRAA